MRCNGRGPAIVSIPRRPVLVMFDLNYTLLRPSDQFGPAGYQRVAIEHGLQLDLSRWEEVERQVHAAADERRARAAGAHDDNLLAFVALRFFEALGGGEPQAVAASVDTMVSAWSDPLNFSLYDDVLPCLRTLRRAGIRMAVVTNNLGMGVRRVLRHFGLDAFLDAVVSSAEVGYTKPSIEVFAAVLGRTGLTPDSAVMVGDNYEDDIKGAQAYGCRAILLDRDGTMRGSPMPRIATLAELPAAIGIHG